MTKTFRKGFKEIGKKLIEFIKDGDKFIVFYNRWNDGGLIGAIEEISKGEVRELDSLGNVVEIELDRDGVIKIFKEFVSYIMDSEEWGNNDYYGGWIDENGDFVLYMEFPYYGVERVIIKRKEKRNSGGLEGSH
jgi:preprotein translocase subunit YajC